MNQAVNETPTTNQIAKKKNNGCLIVLIALAAVISVFIIVPLIYTIFFYSETPDDVSKSELAEIMDLTEEQETSMLSIFDSCGIGEISSVEKFQGNEERTSYHVNDKETDIYKSLDMTIVVWLDNTTKAVQQIYFNDATIYDNGTVMGKITDYYISKEARDTYRVSSQMLVNQCLSYPDTAKYPSISGWRFGVRDGYDVVQSTVTAQNAFGVTNTMQFQVKYERETGSAVSITVDGKEYIGQ